MAIVELGFTKGLNTRADLTSLPAGQATQFSDWWLDYGRLRTRDQMLNTRVSSTTFTGAAGITTWTDSTATGQRIFFIQDGSHIFRSNAIYQGSQLAFTDITNSVTQPSSCPVTWASLNGILVYSGPGMSGKANNITSFAVNSAQLNTGSATGSIVRTVNNIMFFGGPQTFGTNDTGASTFYWSNVKDPTTWTSGNALDFRKNDGDFITAFGELNGNLLIFKQYSIGLLQTQSLSVSGTVTLGPLNTIFQGIGCISPQAVDNLPDGRCVFVGCDLNVYITDGTTLECLTNPMPPGANITTLNTSFGADTITRVGQVMIRYNARYNEINFAFDTTTSGGFWFCYDIKQKYWRKITGFRPTAMCTFSNGAGNSMHIDSAQRILLADSVAAKIFDACDGFASMPSDNTGSAVTPTLELSALIPENFFNSGQMALVVIANKTSAISYQFGFDGTYSSTTTALTGNNYRQDIKIPLFGNSGQVRPTTFNVKFTNTGVTTIAIYKVYLTDEMEN